MHNRLFNTYQNDPKQDLDFKAIDIRNRIGRWDTSIEKLNKDIDDLKVDLIAARLDKSIKIHKCLPDDPAISLAKQKIDQLFDKYDQFRKCLVLNIEQKKILERQLSYVNKLIARERLEQHLDNLEAADSEAIPLIQFYKM